MDMLFAALIAGLVFTLFGLIGLVSNLERK